MTSLKPEKIDTTGEYPCPCGRKGMLVPIALTDAFGCDRCHQIFALEEDGYSIEQLASHYPNKRRWRWLGDRWQIGRKKSEGLQLLLGFCAAVLPIAFSLLTISAGIIKVLLWGLILVVGSILVKVAWSVWRR